jgi:hypothetical protein
MPVNSTNDSCVNIEAGGTWSDSSCTTTKTGCEVSSDCPFFLTYAANYSVSKSDECNSRRASLAILPTYTEYDKFLRCFGKLSNINDGWIGLRDVVTERTFVWDDGTPLTYSSWRSGEPTDSVGAENCVVVYGAAALQGQWNDNSWCVSTYDQVSLFP